MLPELDEEAQAASAKRTLDDLLAFADFALPLIDELDSLPPAAPWGDWLDRLGALASRAIKRRSAS